MDSLADDLFKLFQAHGYQWKIDGELRSPSKQDFIDTFEQVSERLNDEPSGTWLESGRLIFIKQGAKLDVYALQGTITTESSKTP